MRRARFAAVWLSVVLASSLIESAVAAGTPPPTARLDSRTSGNAISSPSALTGKILSNPYCYQPDPALDQCVINIRYYNANDNGSSAPYLLRATLSINGKARANVNLFFENSLYLTYDMAPAGYKVACGAPNAGGGGAAYGNQYLVKLEPLDSGGNSMGYDQASLLCPAFSP
ncbi:MAG: hypothetical protein JSS28_00490 [Proteobacteria bacterium]|nr:hypothetical protein [Pseudomonadota bacterium]